MSWLRTSPLRQSFSRTSRTSRPLDSSLDFDQKACYDSFCKHWQQVYDIILRVEPSKPSNHDDVVGVVSHLDHMVTLLLVELQHCNRAALPGLHHPTPAPCQEFLLSENLLDKLYEWSRTTGRYANAVRLEQLKLYELLVSHSRHQVLVHEPFLRPLLKLLASSDGEIFPEDIEKRLVILLNQLCVVLMQNVHLLDLFFCTSTQQQQRSGQPHGTTNFVIFSLLIPYVHRDGSLGHQARDALLLCMALSQKNDNVGTYIARHSAMCTVLVTGLGGLYSVLPNTIEIASADWHRITADDVADIAELTAFMNALEFCNAVVQVAHELIREQLLDVMYMGFIMPVLGPALLQTFKGNHLQNNAESQISAMAYLDLIMRSVTEPGLLRVFVRFLLDAGKYDGQRMLDVLVERIASPDTRLCMVTLSLFDTLLALQCEDLMAELLLKFLVPGLHIPVAHRHKVNRCDGYALAIDHFLDLSPEVMKLQLPGDADPVAQHQFSLAASTASGPRSLQHHQQHQQQSQPPHGISKTIGANWNHYGVHSGDSLYANYRAYLFDARQKIAACQRGCARWSHGYRLVPRATPAASKSSAATDKLKRKQRQRSEKTMALVRDFLSEFSVEAAAPAATKQLDSLQSLGESSGYESFKYRVDDEADGDDATSGGDDDRSATLDRTTASSGSDGIDGGGSTPGEAITLAEHRRKVDSWKTSSRQRADDADWDDGVDTEARTDDDGTISLGPFITALWGKLQTFTSNCLYVNLHLTGLISRLAWYPLPLTHSILLRPDIPTTSETPSFHQLLRILKQQIDAELPVNEDSLELVDLGRADLIDREFRLINVRKNAVEGLAPSPAKQGGLKTFGAGSSAPPSATTMAQLSSATLPQAAASSSYDPFRRGDSKRSSITTSLSNMFKRQPSGGNSGSSSFSGSNGSQSSGAQASSGLSQILEFFTGNNNTHQQPQQQQLQMQSANGGGGDHSQPASLELMSSMTSTILGGSLKERTRDLALCAIILDEWLKELSAISQEHSICMLDVHH